MLATAQGMAPAAKPPSPPPLLAQFPFRRLETHASDWKADDATVALNARMDARLVPSPASPDGAPQLTEHACTCQALPMHAPVWGHSSLTTTPCQCRHAAELCSPGGAGWLPGGA